MAKSPAPQTLLDSQTSVDGLFDQTFDDVQFSCKRGGIWIAGYFTQLEKRRANERQAVLRGQAQTAILPIGPEVA